MRKIIRSGCKVALVSSVFACSQEASVKAEPLPNQTREEIDFEKMGVSGTITDQIPSVYDGVVRYYDTTGIVSDTITEADVEIARTLIQQELEKEDARLQHWDSEQSLSLTDLDWIQVYALYQLMFDTKATLEERDIQLRTAKENRIVSVRQEPGGLWKLSNSQEWAPMYSDVPTKDLNAMYRFDGFLSQGSMWTDEQISILADALRVLEPRELQYLQGLTWVRQKGSMRTDLAGQFRFENKGDGTTQSITLFDKAFNGLAYSFCGTIEKPYSSAHVVIVHELGHLLAEQPRIAFGNYFNQTVDEFNALVSRFNQTQDQSLLSSINRLQIEITRMEQQPISEKGPIVEAFLLNKSTGKGPTRYADFDVDEAFAESYALYKLDPQALRRIDPPLYQWFASKAYMAILPQK